MYYTTTKLAEKLGYKNRKSFLNALHENLKFKRGNLKLTAIWKCRERVSKCWLFNEKKINEILEE